MKIPNPVELGLPDKFQRWRASQEDAISSMMDATQRVTGISAPTGFGKSPAYVAAALLSKKPTCIVTSTRGLQDQLMRDFSSIGLVDVRGRANYQCEMRDDYTCDDGYGTRCPYRKTMSCPSFHAEEMARRSNLIVTNYDKWMMTKRPLGCFDHIEQLILDEGHDAPQAVAEQMQVILNHREVEEKLQFSFPRHGQDDFSTWKIWAAGAKYEAKKQLEEIKIRIDGASEIRLSWVKEKKHLEYLCRRLSILSTANPVNWVVDQVEEGFKFDPIEPLMYTESVLFLHIPRIVIVSATIRPKTLYLLGQKQGSFGFHEYASDFDRKRCPTYWIPTMRVDSKTTDLSMLWVRLDQLASRRRDRKGIVHTISYARRDDVLKNSRYASSMFINHQGESATAMVERFKQAGPGSIFVSPSISTGYDFPGSECEWQFICKIPFPDGRPKIMKARQANDKEYGPYLAMQTLVQTIGRGMRSKEDQCENIIVDDHMEWFLPRYAHLAPKSFHSFYRRIETMPTPLPPLGG